MHRFVRGLYWPVVSPCGEVVSGVREFDGDAKGVELCLCERCGEVRAVGREFVWDEGLEGGLCGLLGNC